MPEMPGMNLRLPVPTSPGPGTSGHSQDRDRQTGQRGWPRDFVSKLCSKVADTAKFCLGTPGGPQWPCQKHNSLACVPSQPEHQGWGLGQLEPSTYNDHPDKHFLLCQLTGLASPGSCQAPATGEKIPIIPALVERRTGSDSRKTCK